MTRPELVTVRDKLFKEIFLSVRCPIPISDWSMDDRVSLTTVHLQYQAIVVQMKELERDLWYATAVAHLDAARGYLLNATRLEYVNHADLLKALESVSVAMTALES